MGRKTEIEVKVRLPGPSAIGARLEAIGARLLHPREFEDNQLYDFADFALKTRGAMLRVRTRSRGSVLTYKEGGRVEGGAKVRDEMEVSVGDAETLATIIGRLGLRPLFRYQKRRTVYAYSDLMVTIDETPIGTFLEIEGPRPAIDDLAGRLGFSPSEYIAKSYFALYREHQTEKGLPVRDMLFPDERSGAGE
ncbi:MAG: class IV adenylate cyclase [Acidobacteriota bacterium]